MRHHTPKSELVKKTEHPLEKVQSKSACYENPVVQGLSLIVSAAMQAAPSFHGLGVGAAVATILFGGMSAIGQKRLNTFLIYLDDRLGQIPKEVLESEEFSEAVRETMRMASNTVQTEKIALLARLFANYAQGNMTETKDDFEEALRILDGLTVDQFKILVILDDYEQYLRFLFHAEDFTDVLALYRELRDGEHPLTLFTRNQLSAVTTGYFKDENSTQFEWLKRFLEAVIVDLNRIVMERNDLYEDTRFSGIQISAPIRELLHTATSKPSLFRLNRGLLRDAFPNLIRDYESAEPMEDKRYTYSFLRHQMIWPIFLETVEQSVGIPTREMPGVLKQLEATGLYMTIVGPEATGDFGYITPNFRKFIQMCGIEGTDQNS